MRASLSRPLSTVLGLALAVGTAAVLGPAPAALAATTPPLLITEINVNSANRPDAGNASVDAWEFVEILNTTGSEIDLDAADVDVVYLSGTTPKTLTVAPGTVVPARGTTVLWAYNANYRDAAALTEEQFRAEYAGRGAADFRLARLTGQNGLSNSGTSMWLTQGGTEISRVTWTPEDIGTDLTVEYGLPVDGATPATQQPVLRRKQVASPGVVDPALLPTAPDPDPEPEPATEGLLVTEIASDNTGEDHFEFFEVANLTDTPVDVAAAHRFVYAFSDAGPVGTDRPLAITEPTAVVPARGVALFWLQYRATNSAGAVTVDSFARTDEEFRTAVGAPAGTPLFHVTGQAGIANGGARGIRIERAADSSPISWSFLPARTATPNASTHFGVPAPATGGAAVVRNARVTADVAPFTPGTVDPAQLVPPVTQQPDPEEPPAGGVPQQGPPPAVDPTLDAPILQITEVAPDTTNVGSADGYEFVEVYNASDAPVDFDDHALTYLHTDANGATLTSVLWPATPTDPVIQPGRTLVIWVKNGQNDHLTAADFNAHFGSRLTAGVDLIETFTPGMANGSPRGLQIATNTGHDVSRAYYVDDAETVADQPLQYRWDAGSADRHAQTKLGTGTATPGYAAPTQVPAGLVATPADTTGPRITDLTGSSDAPDTDGLALDLEVTDEHLVRTVRLRIDTDVDSPSTRLLRFDAPDRYAYAIPEVDLYGKRWVEYTVVASDGRNRTTHGPVRIDLAEGEEEPLRLNVEDDQFVAGEVRVAATTVASPRDLTLTVDGTDVVDPVPSLEAGPVFAFEATSTDAFFRNGVRLAPDDAGELGGATGDVLTVFDEGFYDRIETVSAVVPVERVTRGRRVTVGIFAGTKAFPEPDPNENNDDFSALNPRLALPDGRVLRPVRCSGAGEGQAETVRACPATPQTRIAFSDANQVYFNATFEIPEDAFDTLAHTWDSTTVTDGPHAVSARTTTDRSVTRTVRVDNTAPTLTPSIADGARLRGPFTITARATDAGAGLAGSGVTATLDGDPVVLPLVTSSLDLAPGEHELVLTARDAVGNQARRVVSFRTADERPDTVLDGPADGAPVTGPVRLTATATSPEDDLLTMRFREGTRLVPTDAAVTSWSGSTGTALDRARAGRTTLSAEQLATVAGVDGLTHEVSSDTALPYQLFTVDVPADAGADASARLTWTGEANAGAKVLMYVRDAATGAWSEVARRVTDADAPVESFTLEATVPTAGHVADGEITVLVQHSEGFAGAVRSTRESAVTPYEGRATPRSDYDFTIGWMSDTQYYNETQDYYRHQTAMNEFLLAQRDALNLQYVIHTGDVVNVAEQERQWVNADAAYRRFDEAGLPYGVLAGNHDVGHHDENYDAFSRWFGADRYDANPWYGESLQDNRGHYDLVSANGVDFLMLYMGWGPTDEHIDWMNAVIARYPERKVWINLHEFMLTTGGLGPVPQRIMDEVVATNPNVFAVSSGHYHDAFTRLDDFDDDGDGVADRTVYSMLFDYQGLPEGGLGFLRLLHFDNARDTIRVRTYSPSLGHHDSSDPSLEPQHQDFEIPYAAVGIDPTVKTLATDAFRADVLTTRTISEERDVPSGQSRTVTWNPGAGEHGWYVETTGPHGGRHVSDVRSVVVTVAPGEPGNPGDPGQPEVPVTVRIVEHPQAVSVAVGETAVFRAAAAAQGPNGSPAVGYQWQRRAAGTGTWVDIADATSQVLRLPAVTRAMHGDAVRVVARSGSATATSEPAALSVGEALRITRHPAPSTVVGEGGSVELTAEATVFPLAAVTYRWQRRAAAGTWSDVAGATGPVLTLAAVRRADHGTAYRVVATSGTDRAVSDAGVLAVRAPLTITSQPRATTRLTAGSALRLRAAVDAFPAGGITYRWQRRAAGDERWIGVAGADGPVLEVRRVTVRDHRARYRLVVTRTVGDDVETAVSSPARLLVTRRPASVGVRAPAPVLGERPRVRVDPSVPGEVRVAVWHGRFVTRATVTTARARWVTLPDRLAGRDGRPGAVQVVVTLAPTADDVHAPATARRTVRAR